MKFIQVMKQNLEKGQHGSEKEILYLKKKEITITIQPFSRIRLFHIQNKHE